MARAIAAHANSSRCFHRPTSRNGPRWALTASPTRATVQSKRISRAGGGSPSGSSSEGSYGSPMSSLNQRFRSTILHRIEQKGIAASFVSASNMRPHVGQITLGFVIAGPSFIAVDTIQRRIACIETVDAARRSFARQHRRAEQIEPD